MDEDEWLSWPTHNSLKLNERQAELTPVSDGFTVNIRAPISDIL